MDDVGQAKLAKYQSALDHGYKDTLAIEWFISVRPRIDLALHAERASASWRRSSGSETNMDPLRWPASIHVNQSRWSPSLERFPMSLRLISISYSYLILLRMSVVCYLQLVFVSTLSSSKVPEYLQLTLLKVALMLQCCVRPSVCLRCSHCARHRTTSDDVVRCRSVSL